LKLIYFVFSPHLGSFFALEAFMSRKKQSKFEKFCDGLGFLGDVLEVGYWIIRGIGWLLHAIIKIWH
jgi:hypothetical protein